MEIYILNTDNSDKGQLMNNKLKLMMRCYSDHPPRELTINEPTHTLGSKIKKNDKNYQEISTRDKIEKDVITDTYNILTKDEQEIKNYKLFFNKFDPGFLYIEFEGKDNLNEWANPRLTYNIKTRSFISSKANYDKLSQWDKEDIIENIKRITEFG